MAKHLSNRAPHKQKSFKTQCCTDQERMKKTVWLSSRLANTPKLIHISHFPKECWNNSLKWRKWVKISRLLVEYACQYTSRTSASHCNASFKTAPSEVRGIDDVGKCTRQTKCAINEERGSVKTFIRHRKNNKRKAHPTTIEFLSMGAQKIRQP